jgi:O-succinylbenzoate synthase
MVISKVDEMKITLWRSDVTLRRPVRAAAQDHDVRTRLFLAVEHQAVLGYGEVAPQPFALNGDPSIDEVLEEVVEVVVPLVLEVAHREGAPPSWSRLARFAGSRSASPFAVALVEMALLDRELRASDVEPTSLWTRNFETPNQATVSLIDLEGAWDIDAEAARVRVKTTPGTLSRAALDRLSELAVPVLLDFNCSASEDAQVLDQVEQISPVATIAAVEQPYAVGNIIDHATLAEQLAVPLSLDEGVRSARDLAQIARYSAASLVCIKPARVGGLANARSMIEKAALLGLRSYLGGFFESPYARHVHRLLAQNCVSEPSDLGLVAVVGSADEPEVESVAGGFQVAPSARLLQRAPVIARWP